MSDSTVPTEHYISTVKAMVTLVNKVDELEGQLRDYEDAFEQLAKDAHNEDNASWWLSDAGIEAVQNSFGAAPYDRTYSADEIREMDEHAAAQSQDGWSGDVDSPVPYTIAEPAPDFSNTTDQPATYSSQKPPQSSTDKASTPGRTSSKNF